MQEVHFHFSPVAEALYRRTAPTFPFERHGLRFDENIDSPGGWLVFCDPKTAQINTQIPRPRRILLINEPSPRSRLPTGFLNQFGMVISPYGMAGYQGFWFQSHPGLPWFFGARMEGSCLKPTISYEDVARLEPPRKQNAVSVIVSNKVVYEGHRKRLRFLEALKARMGSRLVIFGRGIRDVEDKAPAILPFAYHLALENTVEPAYWTEKLADAYLGHALPIYAGCPDVDRWLPADSMLRIDVEDADGACEQIVAAMDGNLWQARRPQINEARRRILEQETVFDVVARAIAASPRGDEPRVVPEQINRLPRAGLVARINRELHRSYHQLTFRTTLGDKQTGELQSLKLSP